MGNDLRNMLKRIALIDFIIALFTVSTMLYFVKKEYIMFFLLGLIVSLLNFLANGFITNYILMSKTRAQGFLSILSFIVRTLLISFIALIILSYQHNAFHMIAYVLGYISQFTAFIIYAVNLSGQN